MDKNISIKRLCVTAMLIAVSVSLSAYIKIPLGDAISLDLGYSVVMVGAMLFGGVYGGIIGFFSRIINDLLVKGSVNVIHIWWAIGSAFFGGFLGLIYTRIIINIRKRLLKIVIVSLTTAFSLFI
ncbi:MAG: ECF transporter S component, partial [Oscillospiraceae bacterium]|nr:ECF transporter S component [Oscillospiraceae bacterium]